MPIDVRQFYQGFFDEVCEHLQHLETVAMELDVRAPDPEHIASLFRIAHSIKGTSATFGFSTMSTLTHALETMLDRVRQGRLALSDALMDVVLRARDVLQAQVDAFRSNSPIDAEAANRLEAELLALGSDEGEGSDVTGRTEEAEESEGYGFFEPLKPEDVTAVPAASAGAASKAAKSEDVTIRVRLDKVERLINLAGQMIVTSSALAQSAGQLDPLLHAPLVRSVDALQRQTRELREGVMAVRMMQVSALFGRYARVVRETSQRLGKDVTLVTSGGDTELDKGLIEQISDPLVHLVRNAVDHGIELPHEREAAGKSPHGTVRLCARHESGRVLIEVSDDGRGLQREKILAKAAELGIEVAPDADDGTIWRLIFAPGFSTAHIVSDVSGRGVGMDVVQHNIARLGGRVDIRSEEGKGTTVVLSVPLTLAIIDGLAVRVDGQGYIIPVESVIESFSLGDRRSKMILTNRAVEFRGFHVPLVSIGSDIEPAARNVAVVVETEGRRAAICVDELQGQYQVVVKSLEENFRRVPGLLGAAVMGSGEIAFIVDVPALVP